MGRKSKASLTHIQNLCSRNSKSQNPSVEDVTDIKDNFNHVVKSPQPLQPPPDHNQPQLLLFDSNDSDSDSDFNSDSKDDSSSDDGFDSDLEDELETEMEMKSDADLLQFSRILTEAQALAIKLEEEQAEYKPKHPRHYTGNSEYTKQFHAQKQCALQAGGQKFINQFFPKKENPNIATSSPSENPAVIDISNEPDDELDEESLAEETIDVEEHLE